MQSLLSRYNTDQDLKRSDGTHLEQDSFSGPARTKKTGRSATERLALVSGVVCLLLLFYTGCATNMGETLPQSASGEKPGILVPGDTIKVSFTTAPELNQSQKIESDGRVSLPLVGEVYAAGKSTGQFQSELSQLYKSQLQNSDVVVTLENVAIPVVVSGEVQKPGKIVFERPATVLEAIMEAGGFTAYGDPKRVSVIRQVNGVQHMQMVDLSRILNGVPTRVMYVSAGDVIYVRPRFVSF
jgi:protein involved in polysaccharide export with SLBB domain